MNPKVPEDDVRGALAGLLNKLNVSAEVNGSNAIHHDSKGRNINLHLHLEGNYIENFTFSKKEKGRGGRHWQPRMQSEDHPSIHPSIHPLALS